MALAAPLPEPTKDICVANPAPALVPPTAGLLELRRISKTFGRVQALHGLDLSVHTGEFVTVVGPSGCGKSTLFNMVAGLEEPDAGGVMRFKGRGCHAAELLGQIAFMPQRDLLLPWRSVIDNAILAKEMRARRASRPAPKPARWCRSSAWRGSRTSILTSSPAGCGSASR